MNKKLTDSEADIICDKIGEAKTLELVINMINRGRNSILASDKFEPELKSLTNYVADEMISSLEDD